MVGETIPAKLDEATAAPKSWVVAISLAREPAVPPRLAVGAMTMVPWPVRWMLPKVNCVLNAVVLFRSRTPPPLIFRVPVLPVA